MKNILLLAAIASTMSMAGGDISALNEIKISTPVLNTYTPQLTKSYEWKFIGVTLSTEREHNFITEDNKKLSTGIRLGIQDRLYRVTLSYKTDYTVKDEIGLETDYLFESFDINDLSAKPYIGASLLSIKHKGYSNRKAAYGFNVGLLVNISTNVDMDFGFIHKRYRDSNDYSSQNSVSIGFNYFF